MFWQESENNLVGYLRPEIDARVMSKTRLKVQVGKVSTAPQHNRQSIKHFSVSV